MKIKWNFNERYGAILIIGATQGANLKTWKYLKAAKDALEITPEDMKTLKIQNQNGQIGWDIEAGKVEYEYDLDEQFIKYLREKIEELDAKNMIPSALLPLVENLGMA